MDFKYSLFLITTLGYLLFTLNSCNNNIPNKLDYSNATTLKDSLLVKIKYNYNSKEISNDTKEYYQSGNLDSLLLLEVNFLDSIFSHKEIRFRFFTEYEDTLIANIDYFFSDTLDLPYINLDLLKEDYLLEVYSLGNTFRIKYKGGNPNVDSNFIMDSIAKKLHNHLESNLNYFYYDIGTNNGEPIIDFTNSKIIESTIALAETYRGLYHYNESTHDSYLKYMKVINDYKFREKKYRK
ncbi:MAG: hypothetical protein LBS88_01575 [Tannerellaceae bacterium]|jgi:hypothetical protein|nr:hypothetical protein [Tannerellaceae bacterium]